MSTCDVDLCDGLLHTKLYFTKYIGDEQRSFHPMYFTVYAELFLWLFFFFKAVSLGKEIVDSILVVSWIRIGIRVQEFVSNFFNVATNR